MTHARHLLACACLALAACSTSNGGALPSASFPVEIVMGQAEPSLPKSNALVIHVEADLSASSTATTETTDGRTTKHSMELEVDGEEVVVTGDEMRFRGERYGPLAPGMVVVIGRGGVRIDGKMAQPKQ